MCGIAGIFGPTGQANCEEMHAAILRMSNTLVHRGPDDKGEWIDPAAGLALGFRRLAILDISPTGRQPMESASGRYIMVFNGEVYNFAIIRQELESLKIAPTFRGGSDTEVMLAAIECWGLEAAVKRFLGMFAFALWDRKERRLSLVRDRLGVKPLYYGWAGRTFLFGSELKALRSHADFNAEIDRNSLALLMRYGYIPAPYTIYQGFHKLLPGTILTLDAGSRATSTPAPYWSAKAAAESGQNNLFQGSDMEAAEQLDTLLQDAVRLRMIADVPVGAFLSGGIDSSLVVALMQVQSRRPVKTFSIGFDDPLYNEAHYGKEVARHLGTEHTEHYVTPQEAQAVIPNLPTLYDEPFADPSQIPTYLVSCLARQEVTVSLSGDGGDELFGGYDRYFLGQRIWNTIGWMPANMRNTIVKGLATLSPFLPHRMRQCNPGSKLPKLAEIMDAGIPEAAFRRLVSYWKHPTSVVKEACEPPTSFTDRSQWASLDDVTLRMLYFDLITYLPDDILTKVDRASMGVSLESREPLLDHRLVEFAWRLPLSLKMRNGQGKWLLRQVLYKYVPQKLIERPKQGFAVPLDAWLRGPLREWAEALLDERRLQSEGYFHPKPIRQVWMEHLTGRGNWNFYLWDVLMFQAWLERR